jgi:hypothetical protein
VMRMHACYLYKTILDIYQDWWAGDGFLYRTREIKCLSSLVGKTKLSWEINVLMRK